MRSILLAAAAAAALAALAQARAQSPGPGPTASAIRICSGLGRANLPGVIVTQADAAGGGETCHVQARAGRTSIEMRLPASGWNGRLYVVGCSGMCGALDGHDQTTAMARGLARGYAVATHDGGHVSASVMDATFARDDPQARADFAEGATHDAALAAKGITSAYYGRAADRAWFDGCSTGGQQGLMEAERHPDDFDGIIVGSPAFDGAGLNAYWTWIAQADRQAGGGWTLPLAAARLLDAAVARRCGDADGLVEDPRRCRFDPRVLACRPGGPASCLTPDELRVVRRWYAGPTDASGHRLYPDGAPLGSETFWDRPGMPAKLGPVMGFQKAAAVIGVRDLMSTPPLSGDVLATFDLERDRHLFDAMDALTTPKPRLAAFAARGGRLLVYQGWADPITPPRRTLAFVRDAHRALGARQADAHLRLFLIPGFNHCGSAGARTLRAPTERHPKRGTVYPCAVATAPEAAPGTPHVIA
jgi:feruloyl esterase